MSIFLELQKVMSEKGLTDTDVGIQELKSEKELLDAQYKAKLSELQLAKVNQKTQKHRIDSELKKDKLNKELLKMMVDLEGGEAGPMAVGGDLVSRYSGVELEPEAQGLPIIDDLELS